MRASTIFKSNLQTYQNVPSQQIELYLDSGENRAPSLNSSVQMWYNVSEDTDLGPDQGPFWKGNGNSALNETIKSRRKYESYNP